MSTKFFAAIAVLTAFTATFASAQSQKPPKASKADVQRVVSGIKSDKTKLAQFCEITKLDMQAGTLAQKNRNDPRLRELEKQMQDIAAKLGPDYEKVINSELDSASAALFDDLSKSCNTGFSQRQAAPKASKADVQNLVNSIKSDKEKFSQFCEVTKLATQGSELARKNQNDPKLLGLKKRMDIINAKLGPEYERVTASDLDNASAALLDNLYKGCK